MNRPQTEAMLAAEVVRWLEKAGWEVYSEVTLPGQQDRADIVAVAPTAGDASVCVVQCKRELSFELLAQAAAFTPHAHAVWVAVPAVAERNGMRTPGRRMAHDICRRFLHIGVLEVDAEVEIKVPAFHRPDVEVLESLRLSLRPEHKTHAAAGSPGGGQYTTWKGTCAALRAFVEAHEGCTMTEAVRGISHHYRSEKSAVSALATWARKGRIPGVTIGWKGRLWSSAEAAARGVTALRLVEGKR